MKKRNAALYTVVTAAITSPASGIIEFTDLSASPLTLTNVGNELHFDLDGGSAQIGSFSGSDLYLSFYYGSYSGKPQIGSSVSGGSASQVVWDGYPYASRLQAGDTIGTASSTAASGLLNNDGGNDTNWAAGTRGFLGLGINPDGDSILNTGWADVEYTIDNHLVLYGFAYETIEGQSINAGQVPEHKTTALFAALAAGSAALLGRRNRLRLRR